METHSRQIESISKTVIASVDKKMPATRTGQKNSIAMHDATRRDAQCKGRESWEPAPGDLGFKPGGIRERAVRSVYVRQGYSDDEAESIVRKYRRRS